MISKSGPALFESFGLFKIQASPLCIAFLLIYLAAQFIGLGKIGIQGYCLAEIIAGFFKLPGLKENHAAILVSFTIVRIQRDRLIKVIEGPFKISPGGVDCPPGVIRDGISPIQRQGLIEIVEGRIIFLLAQIKNAPVNVGIEKFWVQRDGLVIIRQGLLQLASSGI